MNNFQDDSWLGGKPLGEKVEGMRVWGLKPKRDREGVPCEPFALILGYMPDPISGVRYLVCDGRSWRDGESGPWRDEVHIQLPGGEIMRLGDNELAAVREKKHWRYHIETLASMREAALRVFVDATGNKVMLGLMGTGPNYENNQ